jgi:membrane-associated protease RseP (regulator of RpoE activity)
MSLIHMKVPIVRGMMVATLLAVPATSFAMFQQVTTSTSSPSVAPKASAGARTVRCAGCSDSARMRREVLMSRLDSLRWEFSNRRLTPAEQEVLSREMGATIMALQQFLESNGGRMRLAPSARVEAMAGAGVVNGEAYTITVQVAKRGYLGVTFDGPSIGYPEDRPEVIRFLQYPKIASVDPASPAERAGLAIGDTLMAMNGTDVVENSIALSKMLVPNEKMTVKVRRDGDAKEFRVIVGEAPAYVARRVSPMPAVAPEAVIGEVPALTAPGAVSVRSEVRSRTPRPAEAAPMPPMPPTYWEEPVQGRVFVFSGGLAGARVETLPEWMGKAIGVKVGVVVMQVPAGSPAFVSGLREGDVIISAAGTQVTNARQLTGAVIGVDRDNGVKLVIVRDKKQRDLTLRWR